MRQGWTIVPAGLVLVAALMGAGGAGAGSPAPPGDWAAMTDEKFGQSIAPIYLVPRPDVQADLKLDRKQIDSATEVIGHLIDKLLAIKAGAGQAAGADPRREIDEMMAKWLHEELTDAQRERLMQISLQWEGASAMGHPSVASHLGLTEEQRARISQILVDRDRLAGPGKLAPAEFDRRTREAMAVLGPLQRQGLNELLGPPCRFVIKGQPRTPVR